MNARIQIAGLASAVALMLLVSGCETLSPCERNTALGAVIGGVAGSAVTEGSTIGTVGGAVAGGMVGNRATRHGC